MPRLCFTYPWATFGGVERVMLDRIGVLAGLYPALSVDLVFSHDAGGAMALQQALDHERLPARVVIDPTLALDGGYDLVHCIDHPEALQRCSQAGLPHVAECHTAYRENRAYLQSLPADTLKLLVPSELFREELARELPARDRPKLARLGNFIRDRGAPPLRLPAWPGRPVLFFGRMDAHKNPGEFLAAMGLLARRAPGACLPVLCGPVSPGLDLEAAIGDAGLEGQVVLLPAVPFHATGRLLRALAGAGGLLVASSRGESFGLGVAEALAAALPVVLSDIPAHRHLVEGLPDWLYPLGDPAALADRIEAAHRDYAARPDRARALAGRFSESVFVSDWLEFAGHCLPGLAALAEGTRPGNGRSG